MEELPKKETIPPLDAKLDEKGAYFDKHPEDIRPDDLNNLHLWLPGDYLKMLEKALDRKRSSWPTNIDKRHSARWLDQTLREYAKAIEDELAKLTEAQREAINQRADAVELRKALIPLYLALRKKGYSHYDLVV